MSDPVYPKPVAKLSDLPSRQLWLLDGKDDVLDAATRSLAVEAGQASWHTLYVPGPGTPDSDLSQWPDVIPGRQLMRRLGHTVDRLVLDWRHGWHLNHLSQATGCVRAGGQLLILLNAEQPTRYGWHPNRPSRWFPLWRETLLQNGAQLASDVSDLPPPAPAALAMDPVGPLQPASGDQQQAVDLLVSLAAAPRGAGCLISAPRGHGKTVALALAVRALLEDSRHVVVMAAQDEHLTQIRAWLHRAGCTDPSPADRLRSLTWDQWLADDGPVDVVLTDEAAMLGVPRLEKLAQRAPRLACITTTEGYEGSGQGFLLRFLPGWQSRASSWHHLTLTTPIRWAAQDTVTEALQRALLYPRQSASAWLHSPVHGAADWTAPQRLDVADLLQDQSLREDWIHLLTQAHYQTRPDDLRQCLDSPEVLALGVRTGDRLVGLLLALCEPPLPDELAQAVWQGTRRPGSQLAKQSLIGQLGCRDAATWRGWRIWRLVVHPAWQRQGIASALLASLAEAPVENQPVDYLAASFGLTEGLLRFWQVNEFRPVRLGQQAEAASGERALLALRPCRTAVTQFCDQAGDCLGRLTLLHQEQAESLTVPCLLALARSIPPPALSDHERARLQHWCASHQPESALRPVLALALWQWVAIADPVADSPDLTAWVRRLWQNHDWAPLQQQLHLSDRRACVQALRHALRPGSSF